MQLILKNLARYYNYLVIVLCGIIPVAIPMIFWSETFWNSFFLNSFRYMFELHSTFFVNSAAHMFGDRPFDSNINPAENPYVTYGCLGEGYHK